MKCTAGDEIFLCLQAYIDFEISEGEYDRTRELYERLLDRTKHLKVWISCAKFEASAMEEQKLCVQNARSKASGPL
jgi:crooked neck